MGPDPTQRTAVMMTTRSGYDARLTGILSIASYKTKWFLHLCLGLYTSMAKVYDSSIPTKDKMFLALIRAIRISQ